MNLPSMERISVRPVTVPSRGIIGIKAAATRTMSACLSQGKSCIRSTCS